MQQETSYPIVRLNLTIPHSLHHTPLLITNMLNPIRLPRGNKHMRSPAIDLSIKLLIMIDLPSFREFNLAGLAIVITIFAVNCWVDFRKDEAI